MMLVITWPEVAHDAVAALFWLGVAYILYLLMR